MFTGLISALGKVIKYDGNAPPHGRRASAAKKGGRLRIRTPYRDIRLGESISIDGVCLTVAEKSGPVLTFDIGPETQRVTTLGGLKPGARVNLERALRLGERVGGHWVSGHVDETGTIERVESFGRNRWYTLRVPAPVARYVVPKGSLAVDGISLTVADVQKNTVKIMLIPHTLAKTTLGGKKAGDRVNLEPDILAKYAAKRKKWKPKI